MINIINNEQQERLSLLRERIKKYIGGKRLSHTYSVEKEISEMARLFAPELEYELSAAALLHDITKQLTASEQIALCKKFGVSYTEDELYMPKIFHSKTAVEVIRRDFSEYADDLILSAVRFHTTGRARMSIGEKLLFLADYIEATRTYDDCVKLRHYFWDRINAGTDSREKILDSTLIMAFDMTISDLLTEGRPIHRDTVEARNSIIIDAANRKEESQG